MADVGASDQQHEADGAEQQQERRPDRPDDLLAERRYTDAVPGVGRRMLGGDALGNQAGLCLGLLERHARLQPRDGPHVAGVAVDVGVGFGQRPEQLGLSREHPARQRLELGRQHADHGVRHEIESDGATDDVRRRAETTLPQTIGDHHDAVVVPFLIRWKKQTTELGTRPHRSEEAVRYLRPVDTFRVTVAGEDRTPGGVCPDLGEGRAVSTHVLGVGRRHLAAIVTVRFTRAPDHHEPSRLGVRQALEQHAADHAEDRGVGADAERQGQHGDQREARPLGQHAQTVSKISSHPFVLRPRARRGSRESLGTRAVPARFLGKRRRSLPRLSAAGTVPSQIRTQPRKAPSLGTTGRLAG